MSPAVSDSISIYVHIPFCLRKCPYCDFNSYAAAATNVSEQEYTDAVCGELRTYARLDGWAGRTVETVFIGGGTPSLYAPSSIERILATIFSVFPPGDTVEVTLEANPGTIEEELGAEKLSGYRRVGVNRISMGAQSFDEAKLKFLGRIHASLDTKRAARMIVEAGFANFNLDLIFAVADESLETWQADLEQALALQPTHLSAYALTIEPGTEFGRASRRGAVLTAEDDTAAEMFDLTQRRLADEGFVQYEISNYAKPGRSCLHNLAYWSGRDYLGIGAGAHGFLRRPNDGLNSWGLRWSNLPGPRHYIDAIASRGVGVQRTEHIDRDQAETEYIFLGLRKAEGIAIAHYDETFGRSFAERYAEPLESLKAAGLLHTAGGRLTLTRRGFLFADTVFSSFI